MTHDVVLQIATTFFQSWVLFMTPIIAVWWIKRVVLK